MATCILRRATSTNTVVPDEEDERQLKVHKQGRER